MRGAVASRRGLVVVAAAVAFAVAIGFQAIEPLNELRALGSLYLGHGNVGPHAYRFVPDGAGPFSRALDVLPRCPSVRNLALPKMEDLHESLGRVAKIEHIVAIDIFDKDASDRDLAALAGMQNLESLDAAHNSRITDAGVAALAGLTKLRRLDLTNTMVTGTGFKERPDMVNLEYLTLNDCPVTDESLAAIPRYPRLKQLFLGHTAVSDEGLMSLVGWHSLERVTRSAAMTLEGARAFNDAFLAAKRRARASGEHIESRDLPPVFLQNWPKTP